MIYTTTYRSKDSLFKTEIEAKDIDDFNRLVKLRNADEERSGKPIKKTSTIINSKEDLLHYIMHVSDFAMRSKLYNSEDIIGDKGILHELLHEESNGGELRSTLFDRILIMINQLGFPVPDGLKEIYENRLDKN